MRLLKVYGEGQAQAEPDTATLSLNITGVAKEYATAVNQLNSTTERLEKQCAGLAIAHHRVKDQRFFDPYRDQIRKWSEH